MQRMAATPEVPSARAHRERLVAEVREWAGRTGRREDRTAEFLITLIAHRGACEPARSVTGRSLLGFGDAIAIFPRIADEIRTTSRTAADARALSRGILRDLADDLFGPSGSNGPAVLPPTGKKSYCDDGI